MQLNFSCSFKMISLLTAPEPERKAIKELKSYCFSTGSLAKATASAGTTTRVAIYIRYKL